MKTVLKDLISPRRLEYVESSEDKTYGKFVAEPLERGFGTTIGNSLRRYLLSSIPGAAVVGIKIEGVHHEFSTLPNIFEDVSDIILNVKELIVELENPELQILTIEEKGKKEVTGGDIKSSTDVRIVNTDLHIATMMDKNAVFNVELYAKAGRGYVPSEELSFEDTDISIIPVDANYSPIRKVKYTVEKTRVGHFSDYDKLILEVWTNGTIDPEDAVSLAAKAQRNHMLLFMNVEDEERPPEPKEQPEVKKPVINLNRSVEELELSVRSYNCLQKADIKTIAELVEKTDQEMLKTRNFGRKSLNEIKSILSEMGLRLGMTTEEIAQYTKE